MTDPNAPGQQPGYSTPQPGYGAPQQPAYGAPAYGEYGTSGYGGQTGRKTNVLAIVSLIASISGFVFLPFVGPIAGVICGHISLSQIKKTGENGRGLALAGVIVGYVAIALAIIATIAFIAWAAWFAATYGTGTVYEY